MSLVLAIDIGTGSCRCALYNQELQRLSNEIVEYATQYPQPDWTEQDPELIFASILQAMQETVSKSHQDPKKIIALTLDCSIHTLLGLTMRKRSRPGRRSCSFCLSWRVNDPPTGIAACEESCSGYRCIILRPM